MSDEYKIITGDCLDKLKELDDNSIDAIVTDPPYELGFMGKKWDNSGIAYNVELWKEALRVLKHGGHLLSFGGTRTYHRMTCAIEDAGFEIRDCVFWAYGSGFPKSLNIGKKAKEWEGWGTALKPAVEPICMARKPLSEKTIVENVIKWGVGGINIDESRVGIEKIIINGGGGGEGTGWGKKEEINEERTGRFPANLIWTHHPDCSENECVEGCPSKEFDKAGFSKTKANENYKWNNVNCENANTFTGRGVYTPRNDEGTPARFFKSFNYEQEDLDYAPFYYCAKASKSERNEGLKLPDNAFQRGITERKNFHPTVKPIKLMEYLIKMVTPKGGVVLDPFMGSGTTGCACVKNGYKFIGIEMTEEYIPIAEARIKAHVPTQQKLEGI